MKFCEDILKGFQVIEQIYLNGKKSKENNSKGINARVMVPVLCLTSSVDSYVLKVYRNYPEQISIERADRKLTKYERT